MLDSPVMKTLIPLVPNLIFERFNWFEEKVNTVVEVSGHVKLLKIWTVNDCNKFLSNLFRT
jgi:hypothetical protein